MGSLWDPRALYRNYQEVAGAPPSTDWARAYTGGSTPSPQDEQKLGGGQGGSGWVNNDDRAWNHGVWIDHDAAARAWASLNQNAALTREQIAAQRAMQHEELGYNFYDLLAQYAQGPRNWLQYANILGSIQGSPATDWMQKAWGGAAQAMPQFGALNWDDLVNNSYLDIWEKLGVNTGGAGNSNPQGQRPTPGTASTQAYNYDPHRMSGANWANMQDSDREMLYGFLGQMGMRPEEWTAMFQKSLPNVAGVSPTTVW